MSNNEMITFFVEYHCPFKEHRTIRFPVITSPLKKWNRIAQKIWHQKFKRIYGRLYQKTQLVFRFRSRLMASFEYDLTVNELYLRDSDLVEAIFLPRRSSSSSSSISNNKRRTICSSSSSSSDEPRTTNGGQSISSSFFYNGFTPFSHRDSQPETEHHHSLFFPDPHSRSAWKDELNIWTGME